jgi:hypothetical protein
VELKRNNIGGVRGKRGVMVGCTKKPFFGEGDTQSGLILT